MIVIALNYIAKGEGAKKSEVTPFNIDKVPDFIGKSSTIHDHYIVISRMCFTLY